MILLETQQLEVQVADIQVCRDLNLKIEAGQCWGILGRNGAGKTTLLHTLAAMRMPLAGQIALDGSDINQLSRRQIAQHLGVLFQDSEDPFPATVMETALIGRHPHLGRWGWEGPDDHKYASDALRAVNLETMAARQVSTLSGGERRRLAIATLLAQNPALALLDEPTNHLDLNQQIAVLQLLKHRLTNENQAMLLVLHDVNLAMRFCDQLLFLFGDGETLQGPTMEIANEENLMRLYNHPLMELQTPHGPAFLPG